MEASQAGGPAAAAVKATKGATLYAVLENEEGTDHWLVVRSVSARSAKAAIAKVVEDAKVEKGTFVAVPARSWEPIKVATKTQTKLVFS